MGVGYIHVCSIDRRGKLFYLPKIVGLCTAVLKFSNHIPEILSVLLVHTIYVSSNLVRWMDSKKVSGSTIRYWEFSGSVVR